MEYSKLTFSIQKNGANRCLYGDGISWSLIMLSDDDDGDGYDDVAQESGRFYSLHFKKRNKILFTQKTQQQMHDGKY